MTQDDKNQFNRRWMRITLILAGLYNLLWGAVVVLFPTLGFDLLNLDHPSYLPIWQCLGMVVGVYGIGYLAASFDPTRHWPIVLVGLLGKIFGPIGFLYYAFRGEFPWMFGWTIITNDLIWWLPFVVILKRAVDRAGYERNNEASSDRPVTEERTIS